MRLKKYLHKTLSLNFRKQGVKRIVSPFLPVGFHGDLYLMKLVDSLIKNTNFFIETGTNVGSTLSYFARTYPNVQCFSCEPDLQAFEAALKNTKMLSNVNIYNETSQKFLRRIKRHHSYLFKENVLFWLDAHGYGFKWPLKDEVRFITEQFHSAYILIDDFRVPGLDCFKWDAYKEQVCSFEYIKDSINNNIGYSLYYPAYTDHTSKHHPLTGWGLIEFGRDNDLIIPKNLQNILHKAL
jgi:hypothetical protein